MATSAKRHADAGTRAMENGHGMAMDRLRSEFENLVGAMGDRAVRSVRDSVGGMTDRLSDYAGGSGGGLATAIKGAKDVAQGKSPAKAILGGGMSALKDKVGSLLGGSSGGGKGKAPKMTTIMESVDVGVPVQVAYNQWTQFTDFPRFMKKVESVEQESDEKLSWKAQILWSHRSWESTILEQVPDEKIVWRSQGEKGYVDGAVTFHELAPNLTRVLMVLEYHPQGFFEHTGNLWRAQGRRARLELKHFQRHVMTDVIMHPDDVEGWRGVIEDGAVKDQDGGGRTKSGGNSDRRNGRSQESGASRSARNQKAPPKSAGQVRKTSAKAQAEGSKPRRSGRSASSQAQGNRIEKSSVRKARPNPREKTASTPRRRSSARS